jgi:thioredoxin-dependent peroxiredoxin
MSTSSTQANSTVKKAVQVGDPAPDFTLPDADGKPVHFKDLLGKSEIVLYFYPKDESAGCTLQACAFRDSYEDFKALGAEVVGISSDSATSHQAFASKHRLPFILLSDENGKVRDLFDVPKAFGVFAGRVTYIIDRKGIVRHTFDSLVGATKHIPVALKVLRQLHEETAP